MRTDTVVEKELPIENLALYQLITRKLGLTIKGFAEKIGTTPQAIQRLFKMDKRFGKYPGVSKVVREKTSKAFSLSPDWLDQAVDDLSNQKDKASSEGCVSVDEETRPRILNYANAGSLTEALESNSEQCPVIKQLPKYDCTIIIKGDSMEPTFHSGDEIALLNVSKSGFRQWGMPHVLNTRQGIVIKRIYPDEKNKGIKCVSDNKEYLPFVIPEDEVYGVYKIVGIVRWV